MMEYAELAAATNFTFLRGASHPHEMVEAAKALGLSALAITDRNTLAGVVRAHLAARDAGIRLLIGARLVTVEGVELICLPRNKDAYGALARLLTDANFRAADQEREGRVTLADVAAAGPDQVLILIPPAAPEPDWQREVSAFLNRCESPVEYGLVRHFDGQDGARLARQMQEAAHWGLVPVALGDVLFHGAERREMADILTCIREHERIDTAGRKLAAHAERHLKSPQEMARLFAGYEAAVARSAALAARVDFSLDELVYEYPEEVIGEGETPMQTLTRLTWEGAHRRYPAGVPDKVRTAISYELGLIEELNYPSYFLTVHDLVRFAHSKGILCQGRGSAANSSVCFALGVTEVDPATIDLLFERFVSAERNEPPDIDVDFEHQRREEVIQYVYEKYGRRRAGMTAVVSCYRPRGAIREVGKVFGLTGDVLAALSKAIWGWKDGLSDNVIRDELGLDPSSPALARTLHHARELLSFPRHLSQHPGGFVMTLGRLDEIVPVRKAAMPERTAIEWDKEDIEALGLMKVDVLGLGMLSCVSRALAMLEGEYGRKLALADVPGEDTRVYDMICKADTIGVFQIESRAQMTMLPRLRPRTFYDLVIEVAIVRPGPIQGDMVHPYLRRRAGKEKVDYPSEALRQVLEKTKGVPLFQEQAMKIAIVAAGFSPAEADRLRRSMAAFRRSGTIAEMGDRLIRGMVANGYERDFAERCFKQLEGFGEYGFPESHAASFALIVYVSCWLKFHYPDLFLAAMLNAQPLGFYAPAQLVRDAREHGVIVRPPDINHSAWDCTLEAPEPGERTRLTPEGGGARAVRLGLRQIKGLSEVTAARLVAAREQGGAFCSMDDMVRRARLSRGEADRLARGDALRSLSLDRRAGGWKALAVSGPDLPLFAETGEGHSPAFAVQDAHGFCLPQMSAAEHVAADYAALSLSLKAHPVSFLREDLHARGYRTCADLKRVRNGARLGLSGLVLIRQRPGTASGVIFITLEDETGVANLVVWPSVFHRFRRVVIGAKMIGVTGRVQREGEVIHLIAEQLIDQTGWLSRLTDDPFEGTLARADEVNRTDADARMKPRRHGALAPAGPSLPRSRDFH
ncbi:error-prone DNA polymerase [Marinicauda pacifica]|uniref:error-prone DNA polymerase n=1 Tax=Marinicauda pacifica TaxID=1133559 RepID=UPI0035C84471